MSDRKKHEPEHDRTAASCFCSLLKHKHCTEKLSEPFFFFFSSFPQSLQHHYGPLLNICYYLDFCRCDQEWGTVWFLQNERMCLCCAWVLIWVMRKERLEKLTVAAVCCFSTHPLSSGCGAVKVFMWVCDTPRCSKRLHLFCQRDLRVRSVYRAPRRSLALSLWPACVRKLFVLISQRFFQLCGSVLWKKREERRRWGERDSWPSNSITSAAGLDGPLMIV